MTTTAGPADGGAGPPGGAGPVGEAVVVGAGVVGLTTALTLAEAGWSVRVVADRPWPETTSRVAGAVWEPYLSAGPSVLAWAAHTYGVLAAEAAAGVPGVTMGPLVEGGPHPVEIPAWTEVVGGARRLRPAELAPGWVDGFTCQVPFVAMDRYLPHLHARLADTGGHLRPAHLGSTAEAGPADVVVNCAGLGARDLVGDRSLRPIRGQVVVVDNPGIIGALMVAGDAAGSIYRIAHPDLVVLGGTADLDAEDTTVDPAVTAAILASAAALEPGLAGAEVREVRVGLRPWRPEVRLEVDPSPPPGVGLLVHNYGHGGSGVTLSWGCAAAVAAAVAAARGGAPTGAVTHAEVRPGP